jgi:glyoxylase-like metal-dependent hydrolase (beta-lactamase superfamily II)
MIKKMSDNFHEVEEIAPDTYRLNEGGIANCYLLIGKTSALLIDSGCGVGDLGKCLKELTNLPVTLAVTHRHCDHAGGRTYFKEYWVHKKDRSPIYGVLASSLASKTLLKGRDDIAKPVKLSKGGYPHSKPRYMDDDKVFHLGDRDVSIVNVPGHTRGSVVFLDNNTHLMFTGDDVNPYLWMQLPGCTTITEWLIGANKILSLADSYTPYNGHNDGLSSKEDIVSIIKVMETLLKEKPAFKGKTIDYPNKDAKIHVFIAKKYIK